MSRQGEDPGVWFTSRKRVKNQEEVNEGKQMCIITQTHSPKTSRKPQNGIQGVQQCAVFKGESSRKTGEHGFGQILLMSLWHCFAIVKNGTSERSNGVPTHVLSITGFILQPVPFLHLFIQCTRQGRGLHIGYIGLSFIWRSPPAERFAQPASLEGLNGSGTCSKIIHHWGHCESDVELEILGLYLRSLCLEVTAKWILPHILVCWLLGCFFCCLYASSNRNEVLCR